MNGTALERRDKVAHIEIGIDNNSPASLEDLREQWQNYLVECERIDKDTFLSAPDALRKAFAGFFSIQVEDRSLSRISASDGYTVRAHVYVLSREAAELEELEPADGDQEWTAACENLALPHCNLKGLWDSLLFKGRVKQNLLDFATSALLFAERGVSGHLVHLNRMILLHGPAGTGKTSLCRALAQKLAIRMGRNFRSASILEIHSHSLFSKWFSTSGKLIHRLFDLIKEMAEDEPNRLVCVLIDEIESLASSRSAIGGAGEPTDAVRAVNSLLTSLDRLRTHPNVLVLATTNITGSVDTAFLDRADMKVYIGPPCLEARYEILRSSIAELLRVGIIVDDVNVGSFNIAPKNGGTTFDSGLRHLAGCADGLSGRSLRRLPVQAHALFLQHECVSLKRFLEGLGQAIQAELESTKLVMPSSRGSS